MRVLLPVLTFALAAANQATAVRTLDQLRDQARPLLIFVPHPSDPRLIQQANLLSACAPSLRERQVLIFIVTEGAMPASAKDPTVWQPPLADTPDTLRRRFAHTTGDFSVILLGKDGGEKLRVNHPLSCDTLRREIDAMPMRQQELRHPR